MDRDMKGTSPIREQEQRLRRDAAARHVINQCPS
jgi:hypothetical protein